MSAPTPAPDPQPSLELIEAAAASWLSLRDRGMTPAETTEFMHWLQEDARHATVFAELDQVWRQFDRLAPVATPAAVADGDLLAPRPRRRSPVLAWMGYAAAAALVGLLLYPLARPSHTAETVVGAFQKLDLPDGSVAQLNTDSAIDVNFTTHERRVSVVRGEVFFSVAKNPDRPFIVTAGPVQVRAVGTAFNVRRGADRVDVLVTEGRVRVADAQAGRSLLPVAMPATEPPLLIAGERATIPLPSPSAGRAPLAAQVVKITSPEIQRTLAWQERRLEFEGVPLAEVVAEFNRYNHRQLVITDPALATKQFSGAFRADNYDSFVRLLEENFHVIATPGEHGISLHGAR